MQNKLQTGDALLLVDPQLDFFPGGALAVADGEQIIPVANSWLAAAQQAKIPLLVSRDWHPANHLSFHAQGGIWPSHCVQQTAGAAFHPQLNLPATAVILNKGFIAEQEAYSAFGGVVDGEEYTLNEKLISLGVKRVWLGGLALDYCVLHSALDARKHQFAVQLILPACKAINQTTAEEALQTMRAAGVTFITDANPY